MIVIRIKPLGWAVLACLSAGSILIPLSRLLSSHGGTSVAIAAGDAAPTGFSDSASFSHVLDTSPAAAGAIAASALRPGQLARERVATFCGRVARSVWSPDRTGVDIAFIGNGAAEAPVVAEIGSADFGRFPDPAKLVGHSLLVTGPVAALRGRSSVIQLTSMDQVMDVTLSRR